jgi:hypothetical protein
VPGRWDGRLSWNVRKPHVLQSRRAQNPITRRHRNTALEDICSKTFDAYTPILYICSHNPTAATLLGFATEYLPRWCGSRWAQAVTSTTGAHNACFQQVQDDMSKTHSVNRDWEFVSKGTKISPRKFKICAGVLHPTHTRSTDRGGLD